MAVIHLLGLMVFAKSSINPNTVRLKPRKFNNKGKAKRAPRVTKRFFQLISRDEKIDFSSTGPFFRAEIIRFNKEKIPRRRAARKGIKPDSGFLKVPKEA